MPNAYSMFSGQVLPTPFVQNSAQFVLRKEIMDEKTIGIHGDLAMPWPALLVFLCTHCTQTWHSSLFGNIFTEEFIPDKDQTRKGSTRDVCNAGILWTHTLGQLDSKERSPNHFVVCMTTMKYMGILLVTFHSADTHIFHCKFLLFFCIDTSNKVCKRYKT